MRNLFNGFGLKVVHNNTPTHFNIHTLLDIFVVNCKIRLNLSNQFWTPGISNHDFIVASFNIDLMPHDKSFQFSYYKSINVDSLLAEVDLINSDHIFALQDINYQVCRLTEAILGLFRKHVPVRTVKLKVSSIIYRLGIPRKSSIFFS